MTSPFVESFKSLFQKLNSIDVSAVSLSIKEAIQFFSNQKYCVLPMKHTKTGGILVPKYSDLVGNVISLPLNPLGNNQTEKYLNAIEYTLLLYKHFGIKVVLSELAFPVMNLTESQETDIFLDGVPSLLRGLVPSENLYFCRNKNTEPLGSGDILWQRLHAIREMYDLLSLSETKKNELVAMAEAFSGGEGQIFFVVDRLIEKKAAHISKRSKKAIDQDSAARGLTRKLKTWMDQIVMTWSSSI
jgi:CRISPR-associated protein Csc3